MKKNGEECKIIVQHLRGSAWRRIRNFGSDVGGWLVEALLCLGTLYMILMVLEGAIKEATRHQPPGRGSHRQSHKESASINTSVRYSSPWQPQWGGGRYRPLRGEAAGRELVPFPPPPFFCSFLLFIRFPFLYPVLCFSVSLVGGPTRCVVIGRYALPWRRRFAFRGATCSAQILTDSLRLIDQFHKMSS